MSTATATAAATATEKPKFKAPPGRLIVYCDDREKASKGGIVFPQRYREGGKPQMAEVLAVGIGLLLPEGGRNIPQVEVGDRVLFLELEGNPIDKSDKRLRSIEESKVMAIVGE